MEQSLSTNLMGQNAKTNIYRLQTIGYSVYQFAPPNLQVRVRVRAGPGGGRSGGDAGAGTASETCGTSL